jgi:hypothetical protein
MPDTFQDKMDLAYESFPPSFTVSARNASDTNKEEDEKMKAKCDD